jgi:uncharacterized protein YggE
MKFKSILFLILVLSQVAIAQHAGNQNYVATNSRAHVRAGNPSPYVGIEVNAMMNVKAVTYTAVFNVSQVGGTSETTNSLINDRINKINSGLLSMGLEEESIHIDMISFVPVYEVEVEKKLFSKTYNEVPKGFEIQKNIHINFKEPGILDEIITLCAQNEIYDLVKVDYFVDDLERIYDSLQQAALRVVESKKEFYKAVGVDFDKFDMIFSEKRAAVTPHDAYSNYQAFSSISIDAVKQKKGLTKVKKQVSLFYNPISYKNFDVVINPVINEPVVQFTLNLKLNYTPKPKQPATVKVEVPTNKYYVLMDDGQLKELKVECVE